jgi:NAD-dependent DNA ligase
MSTPLHEIKGIGPSTAKDLERHGFKSAEDLATATADEIAAVPGFGAIRARQIKAAAVALLQRAEAPDTAPPERGAEAAEPVEAPAKAGRKPKGKDKPAKEKGGKKGTKDKERKKRAKDKGGKPKKNKKKGKKGGGA